MAARDLALSLLSQGLQPSVVAATVGVEESYISQLMSNEDFAVELESRRVKQSEQDIQYDQKLDTTEAEFLERISDKVRQANFQQSMQAFKVLNAAKRRKDRSQAISQAGTGVVVNINLPSSIIPTYVMNQQSEIIEVNGKTMISATPKTLDALVEQKKAADPVLQKLDQEKKERASMQLDAVRPVKPSARRVSDILSVDVL